MKVFLSSNVKGALTVPQHVSFAPSAVVNEILEERNGAMGALLYLSIIFWHELATHTRDRKSRRYWHNELLLCRDNWKT